MIPLNKPISQLLIIPYASFPLKLVNHLLGTSWGAKGFGSTDKTVISLGIKGEIIQLSKSAGWPPGTHFLGATPCQAPIRLMSITGTKSSVIIDSGSNISLISSQLIPQIQPTPKIKTGQKIKISQVTGWSSTDEYVNIDLYFDMEDGPVKLNLEAYVVKDMNAPIILGNEFADQYSLSIIWNEEGTTLQLGTSGRSISLTNSVESSYLDVKAYNLLAYKQQHNRSRWKRRSMETPRIRIKGKHWIPAHSIKLIPIQIRKSQSENILFTPTKQLPRQISNLTILDSIITPSQTTLHVTNDTDGKVYLLSEDIIRTSKSLDQLDLQVPIDNSESINAFSNWVKSILKKPQDDPPRGKEQLYQDQIHDLPTSPKTAEVPPLEDVLAKDLLTTLDFNPKLTSDQNLN